MRLIVIDHATPASPARRMSGCGGPFDGALARSRQPANPAWLVRCRLHARLEQWSVGARRYGTDADRTRPDARWKPVIIAWDSATTRPVTCDTSLAAATHNKLALDLIRIATAQGEVVCQISRLAALCRLSAGGGEATCWIPRAQLEEAARLIWQARPVSYYAWSGHEQHANVTETARAMALLYALTGCFTRPVAMLLPAVPSADHR
jgi:hypothetical protein